jgi:hypothetical protein
VKIKEEACVPAQAAEAALSTICGEQNFRPPPKTARIGLVFATASPASLQLEQQTSQIASQSLAVAALQEAAQIVQRLARSLTQLTA